MRHFLMLTMTMSVGCKDSNQEEIVEWAGKSIDWEEQQDGVRLVTFATPYFYGDKIKYDSINGKGTGYIDGIVLAQDGSVCYEVMDESAKEDDGQLIIRSGIYPDEITLIQRGLQNAEQNGADQPATAVELKSK